ncbi:MAG: hypothetical protein Q9163_004390 [Psora crenata]
MELYATGFNEHQQLISHNVDDHGDITTFQHVHSVPTGRIKVWAALWSATVIESQGQLWHYGCSGSRTMTTSIKGLEVEDVRSVFGDLSGLLGAVGKDGSLYVFYPDPRESMVVRPVFRRHKWLGGKGFAKQGWKLEHVAVADSDDIFKHWVSTSFIALLADHTLLTFGSPLHPSLLARTPTPATIASEPHHVSFLGGVAIRKIASSGWIGAALSMDRDLYIWGGRVGEPNRISALPDAGADECEQVKLVDINGGADILDVAVAMAHISVLTVDGEIWVCGNGEYGQLGLGEGRRGFETEWLKVQGPWEGRDKDLSVEAGGWGTLVVIDHAGKPGS